MNSFTRPELLRTGLRAAALALAAAAGLTAAPTRAADGTLGRDGPPMPVSGAEAWALRPGRPSTSVAEGERIVPLAELPDARRRVRVVYRGYFTPAALSAAR